MNGIEAHWGTEGDTVVIDLPLGFARGDSDTAVRRKIVRHAQKIGLEQVPFWGPLTLEFWHYSAKDDRRFAQLMVYANGRAIKKTARNNWGKHNDLRWR